jgi:hypothetical protein
MSVFLIVPLKNIFLNSEITLIIVIRSIQIPLKSDILILCVPYESFSRNASCALRQVWKYERGKTEGQSK